MTVDVVVVGAGLAGLVAARDVQRAGLEVLVLEARDRVGGRIWSETVAGGVVDLGGQFAGPMQERLLALAAEEGVETFPTYVTGHYNLSIAGRTDLGAADVIGVLEELDRLAAEVPREAPWTAPRALEWDAQTFRTWLDARVQDPDHRTLLRLITTALFTAEPDELSLLHVLAYIRSAGSVGFLTQVEGGAQEWRFVGGAQRLADRLAQRIGPAALRLGGPVRAIRQGPDGVVVETDGDAVAARRAIVAVPLALADRIAYEPALPALRSQLHQRVAPGATIKLHFVYETPFWREAGLSGRTFTDLGHLSVTFDNSPPSGTPGILVGFVEADAARAFNRLDAEERRERALADLVRWFGPRAAEPIEVVETDWSAQEWTRGCYGANLPPGGWTRYGETLREPVGLIHWAGAETSPVWMNYMEGAVRSGERVAAEVAAALALGVSPGS